MIPRPGQGFFEQDPEAGPGPSTARFYARSDTAPHLSDHRTSTSTSPEDDSDPRTLYSDEEYIVNAITRPTPNDDHKTPDVQPVEEDLASHVAMFLPSNSSHESAPQSSCHGKILGQERTGYWWRGEFISDGLYKPYSHLDGEIRPPETAIQPARRRAISLETFDGSAANPQWPRNVPAVRVHQPPYPPPERMPTPPGLPSFGTPEAMATSAQFLRGPESSASRRREHSPTAAIRRLFGLQPPAQSTPPSSPVAATAPTAAQSVQGIGRAPDGTAVLGRFGYRQSGHGINLTQGLDDHTFHEDDTPDAPAEPTSAEPAPAESRRSSEGTIADSFKSTLSRPKRYGRLFRPSVVGLFVPSSPARGSPSPERGSSSPERGIPLPGPVLAVPPRNPARGQRQQGNQDRSPRANSSPNRRDLTIRDAQMRETSPMSHSFQRHTVVNQTIQEEESDTEAISQPSVARKVLSQIPVQIPLCCCFGGRITQRVDEGTPLEVIASRSSYATAPSRSSPTRVESPERHENNENNPQSESRAWTPLYNFVRRGVAVFN